MSGDNDFELPDIDDSWLDGHEVLDDEHPIYTDYDTDDYNNEEYEDIDEIEQPTPPPVRRRKKKRTPQRENSENSTDKPRRKKPVKKRKSVEKTERPRPKKRRTHNTPPPPRKRKPTRRVEPEEEYYDYEDDYSYGGDDYSVDYDDSDSDYTDVNDDSDNMHVDKKTGVSYELLPGSDKAAVTAYKKSKGAGLTLEQMFAYTDMADDFDGMDLSASASRFLPHMQVPISREEREAAREKLRRSAQRNKERNARKYAVRSEEDNRDTPEGAMGNPKRKRRKPRKRPR